MRVCLASGVSCAQADLIRFVIDPAGVVVPDISGKLPGRGYWVKANRTDLERAIAQRRFARAARRAVTVPAGLVDQVERGLAQKCLARLGLGFRAGQVCLGFERVLALAATGRAAVLIAAQESAVAGRMKIWKVAQRPASPLLAGCFARDDLGLALGRHNVVHAALSVGGMADRFIEDLKKLQGFRPLCPPSWAAGAMTDEKTERPSGLSEGPCEIGPV